MYCEIEGYKINVEFNSAELGEKIPIVFLHGFSGNLKDWLFLKDKLPKNYSPILIDLLGHGKSDSPNNEEVYSSQNQIKILSRLKTILNLSQFYLVGYSMGGRLAISYALQNPSEILGLVIESTSFGIEGRDDRESRIKDDISVAERINSSTLNDFFEFWYNQPIFKSINNFSHDEKQQFIKKRILSNNKIGLINSLKGFSTGKMDYLMNKLSSFDKPVLIIAGQLDNKYVNISKVASKKFKNCDLRLVPNCGHNVHFEKPQEFLKFLNEFLKIN